MDNKNNNVIQKKFKDFEYVKILDDMKGTDGKNYIEQLFFWKLGTEEDIQVFALFQ